MQPLEVTSRAHDGFNLVRLRGELDIANAEEFRLQLRLARRENGDRVVLDLAELDFMDSHGLSVIISCYKSVTEAGGSLALAGPRPIVRRTLEITGLDRRLTVVDTVEEAVDARSAETGDSGGDAGADADGEDPEPAEPVAVAGPT